MENLTLGIIFGMIAHEAFHIFLAIGGFAVIKKLISKHFFCCDHKHKDEEKKEDK